jgi:hypothetical protein
MHQSDIALNKRANGSSVGNHQSLPCISKNSGVAGQIGQIKGPIPMSETVNAIHTIRDLGLNVMGYPKSKLEQSKNSL